MEEVRNRFVELLLDNIYLCKSTCYKSELIIRRMLEDSEKFDILKSRMEIRRLFRLMYSNIKHFYQLVNKISPVMPSMIVLDDDDDVDTVVEIPKSDAGERVRNRDKRLCLSLNKLQQSSTFTDDGDVDETRRNIQLLLEDNVAGTSNGSLHTERKDCNSLPLGPAVNLLILDSPNEKVNMDKERFLRIFELGNTAAVEMRRNDAAAQPAYNLRSIKKSGFGKRLISDSDSDTTIIAEEEEADEFLNMLDKNTEQIDTEECEISFDDSESTDISSTESDGEQTGFEDKLPSSTVEAQPFIMKDCYVKLNRLEDMKKASIAKICSLHNLHKRTVFNSLHRLKRARKRKRQLKKRKRYPIISSDSSGSNDFWSADETDVPARSYAEAIELNVASKRSKPAEILADQVLTVFDTSSLSSSSEGSVENGTKRKRRRRSTSLHKNINVSEAKYFVDPNKPLSDCSDKDESDRTLEQGTKTTELNADEQIEDDNWRNDPLLSTRLLDYSDVFESTDSKDTVLKHESVDIEENSLSTYKIDYYNSFSKAFDNIQDTDSDSSITIVGSSNDENSDVEFVPNESIPANKSTETLLSQGTQGRRNIRTVLSDEELTAETQRANREELARVKRLEEHSRLIEPIKSQSDALVLDIDDAQQPLITVNHTLYQRLKEHQRKGVEFMWQACYESVSMIKKGQGTGCILAHCMGLGKTFQVITLLHTLYHYSQLTGIKRTLIICPLSVVLNWRDEFKIAFSGANKVEYNFRTEFLVHETRAARNQIVCGWYKNAFGVLVMSYEAFTTSLHDKNAKDFPEQSKEALWEELIDPGPDLVVCDEGHRIRNKNSLRYQYLNQIRTKRRIILTGTPMQNNLKEYYYMVEFVKPRILGTFKEYCNRFVTPIMNGQYFDSTQQDIRQMKRRTHVLTKLLRKTIQRYESSILKETLPPIYDYTILLQMHPVQVTMYSKFIDWLCMKITDDPNRLTRKREFLRDFVYCKYISFHPYILHEMFPKSSIASDQSLDVATKFLQTICPSNSKDVMEYGIKVTTALQIIIEVRRLNEKVLVFSSNLDELTCLEHFLNKSGLLRNMHYYRMDGSTSVLDRSKMCSNFNYNESGVFMFLISHKVGGQGINLTGANRIILLSSDFNPCQNLQSIYRAYRYGQTKSCFVYRLIAMGTMEEKIYQSCVVKLAVATTVVDKFNVSRHFNVQNQVMYDYHFNVNAERPVPAVPVDTLLAKILQMNSNCFKYHDHQGLLENRPDEELNDDEKKRAWEEFNSEQNKEFRPGDPNSSLKALFNAKTTAKGGNTNINSTPSTSIQIPQQRTILPTTGANKSNSITFPNHTVYLPGSMQPTSLNMHRNPLNSSTNDNIQYKLMRKFNLKGTWNALARFNNLSSKEFLKKREMLLNTAKAKSKSSVNKEGTSSYSNISDRVIPSTYSFPNRSNHVIITRTSNRLCNSSTVRPDRTSNGCVVLCSVTTPTTTTTTTVARRSQRNRSVNTSNSKSSDLGQAPCSSNTKILLVPNNYMTAPLPIAGPVVNTTQRDQPTTKPLNNSQMSIVDITDDHHPEFNYALNKFM